MSIKAKDVSGNTPQNLISHLYLQGFWDNGCNIGFEQHELLDFINSVWNTAIEEDESYCDNCTECSDYDQDDYHEMKQDLKLSRALMLKFKHEAPEDWEEFYKELMSHLDY